MKRNRKGERNAGFICRATFLRIARPLQRESADVSDFGSIFAQNHTAAAPPRSIGRSPWRRLNRVGGTGRGSAMACALLAADNDAEPGARREDG